MESKKVILDDFSEAFLKTLNSIYKDFQFVKKEGNIYVFGYKKDTCKCEMPKAGGTLEALYPEIDIVIVDKDCVKSLTKEYLSSINRWKDEFENKDILLGFSSGCKVFGDYAKRGY